MDNEKDCCPNCNIEFENDSVSDVHGGNVLISTWVEYCPECLYVNNSDIELSK